VGDTGLIQNAVSTNSSNELGEPQASGGAQSGALSSDFPELVEIVDHWPKLDKQTRGRILATVLKAIEKPNSDK